MIPSGSYFFTGTDTGIGKTTVACHWIAQHRAQGVQIVPMKPIAAGCRRTPDGWRNDDAEQLLAAAKIQLPYERVNRYAFVPAIAPHIAAAEAGIKISLDAIVEDFHWLQSQGQYLCVEGAGGWRVPLGHQLNTADIPRALNLEVVLVVGIRLGCLNHALLSAAAILADGCRLAGWVANFCDPNAERAAENCASLVDRIEAPLLCSMPYNNYAAPA